MIAPAEVFDRAIRSLLAYDAGAYAELFTSDAVVEWPFAPDDRPKRLQGREAIRAYVHDVLTRTQAAGRRFGALLDVVTHPIGTHELAAEFSLEIQTPEGVLRRPYVHFLRVTSDGQIASLRDYMSLGAVQPRRAPEGSPSAPTAVEVIHRVHERVRAYDIGVLDDFYAEDAVLEMPFAPPPLPKRVVGRDAIRALLGPRYEAMRAAGQRIGEYRSLQIHESRDPEVIVAEIEVESPQRTFVLVYRIAGGRIRLQRDYFDSLATAERLRATT